MFSWLSLAPGTDAGLEMLCFLGAMLVFDNESVFAWLLSLVGARRLYCAIGNTPDVLEATYALFSAPRDANLVGEVLQPLRIHFLGLMSLVCAPHLRRATGATPERREPQHAPPAALWIAVMVGKAPQRHRLHAGHSLRAQCLQHATGCTPDGALAPYDSAVIGEALQRLRISVQPHSRQCIFPWPRHLRTGVVLLPITSEQCTSHAPGGVSPHGILWRIADRCSGGVAPASAPAVFP
ncbi:hypothetical protein K438DRAFT_1769774 [Mycena galopus ATCC 62051]|nr:hypothetical protein K438DRAFT_1769774 [Mycena galopus ATCC 62051]